METITLKVEGMRCSMCEAHVCDAIRKALPSAKKTKANHRNGLVTFNVEYGLDFAPAIEKIESLGYKVLESGRAPAKKSFSLFHK